MNDSTAPVNSWEQLSLLPPLARTITVHIELDPVDDVAHYDLSIVDSGSGDLVALHVMPMRSSAAWPIDLQALVDRLHGAIGALVDPF